MHRRRRCSGNGGDHNDTFVTSRNTYHEIENDDDDEDENDDRFDDHNVARDQHFREPLPSEQEEPGSSYYNNNNNDHDHDQYRQREFEQPGQSRQQQNTRAFVHSEAHPEPAAEGALLRERPEQRRPGQSGLGAGLVGRKAQSGRAVKSRDEDQEVILDDKSVAEVSED